MAKAPEEYLRHMRDEANFILNCLAGHTKEEFVRDETLKRAIVRSLEIIGEAVKQVPEAYRGQHPEISWRAMAGMRDRLIHGYLEVDYDIVWEAAHKQVAELRNHLLRILGETG